MFFREFPMFSDRFSSTSEVFRYFLAPVHISKNARGSTSETHRSHDDFRALGGPMISETSEYIGIPI